MLKKILVGGVVLILVAGLVADNVYLHFRLQETSEGLRTTSEGLRETSERLQATREELQATREELWEALEDIEVLADAAARTERWIATSSVQGKWNDCKEQFRGYEQKAVDKFQELKDAAKRTLSGKSDGER